MKQTEDFANTKLLKSTFFIHNVEGEKNTSKHQKRDLTSAKRRPTVKEQVLLVLHIGLYWLSYGKSATSMGKTGCF